MDSVMATETDDRLHLEPRANRLTPHGRDQARKFATRTKAIVRQCISGRLFDNGINWVFRRRESGHVEELACADVLNQPYAVDIAGIEFICDSPA